MSRLTKKLNDESYWPEIRKVSLSQLIDKLGKLEDLEEKLGCPLEVVFKALTDGFEYETGTIYQTDLMKGLKGGYSFSCRSGLNTIYKSYYLKDYKKNMVVKR